MARCLVAAFLLLALTVVYTDAIFCSKSKHCSWGSWGAWCSCKPNNGKCGPGVQYHYRHLKRNGKFCIGFRFKCSGSEKQTRHCNGPCCPRDCRYGSWSSWSSCNYGSGKTCGAGSQHRTRKCAQTAYCGGKPCSGSTKETRSCSKCCPVDCLWGGWGKWSSCSRSCGGGTESRSRSVSRPASCGGKACTGSSKQNRSCNKQCCAQNCIWSNWCDWSGCTKTCGGGRQARTRAVKKPASCGGTCSGDPIHERSCNALTCPPECIYTTVCEHQKKTITCHGKKIHVTSASYGRSDDKTCLHDKIQTTSCHAEKSLQLVRSACDGKTTCTLHAPTRCSAILVNTPLSILKSDTVAVDLPKKNVAWVTIQVYQRETTYMY